MGNPTHVQLFNGQALVTGGGVFEPDALIPQVPAPPTNVSADTPIGTSGQALVTFTPPANTGNVAINEYVGISIPGNIVATCAGTATQMAFTGLTLGVSYVFFIQSVNSVGTSLPSLLSNSITPTYYPAAPVIGVATAGVSQMSVAFTPVPVANDGGTPITNYIATANPGGLTGQGTTSPIIIPGLTNTVQYNATVQAVNAYGTGPASAPSNFVTPQAALNPPGKPGNFSITGQGNNSISLAWNAAVAGSNPVASYNLYRNGAFLINVSTLSYTDSGATNANMPNSGGYPITTQGPSTAYSYTVSAVDNAGNEGTQQQILSWLAYYNGTNNGIPSAQDYSYLLTPNYTDTSMTPQHGNQDIRCDITGTGGIWQPTFGGNVSRWTFNASMMDHFQFSVKPTIAGQDFSISIVSRQQSPTGDVFSTMHTLVSAWTTLTANAWNNVIIPLSAMSVGDTTFIGTIGAPYSTVTIDANGNTYHAATLTVTSVVSGPGVDVGAFILGSSVPTGSYLWSSSNGTTGPFVITGPNVPASLNVSSENMTSARHDLYKLTMKDVSGASSNHFGFDNINFYGTQTLGVNGSGVPSQVQNAVGTPGNGQISIAYSAPSSQGGSAIVSYTFTTTDNLHTLTTTANPAILTGLTNNVAYSINCFANNSNGQSLPVTIGPYTPAATVTVPSPVTNVVAVGGNASATLSWTPPSSNGGSTITGYTVTSTDGTVNLDIPFGTNSTPVTGLINGNFYTFNVVANNSVGPGSPGVSNQIQPEPPTTAAVPVLSTWGFIGSSYVATMSVQYITTPGTYAALFNQPSSVNEYMQTQMVIFQGTGTLIEVTDNEGPNPPNTATGTLSMTALNNETAGNTNITMFTGACYGNMTYVGQHSNRVLSDTENGSYVLAGYLQGQDQQQGGSINQSQENDVFYLSSIAGDSGGTRNVWTGTYTGGDGDYEALLNSRWSGLGAFVGYRGNIQNNVAPGSNVLTSGSITLTAAQVPATLIGWCNNLSGLGSHYTPSVGVGLPFAPLVTPNATGNYGSATAGSGSASVSFTPVTQPSGTPAPTSFTVTAYPGGKTVSGSASPLTVPNLTPGNYTFTVFATNSNGNGPASPPFGSVTIAGAAVPSAPPNVTASAGNGQATVGWGASNANGSAITGYTINAAFGDTITPVVVGPSARSAIITGLTNNVGVAFYVFATNGIGNSPNSANSPTVVPTSSSNTPGYDGVLTVSGNKLLNGHGVILQPRGGNAEGLDYGAIQKLATWPNNNTQPPYSVCQAWKMNMMRIPLNAASWLGLTVYDPSSSAGNGWGASMQADYNGDYKSTVIATARALQAAGMYVMFDVHLTAPQFTFGGVTHWLRPNNAPYYPDAMCLAFWQSFALTFGTQATPQPGVNNSGIIFNIINEPHGVFGSGGPYTKGPNGTGGAASSDWLFKNGGYGSKYDFLAFPYTGSWVSGTINQSWQVISYQQIVNAIRATGAANIIALDSDSYATMAQTTLNWLPTDPLSTPQLLLTLHPYGEGQFGSYPYTGNGIYPYSGTDSGAGTSSWGQWFEALNAQGYAICFSEDGGHYASGQSTEPHVSYILGLADTYGIGYLTWGFNSANQFGAGSSGWMQAIEQVNGATVPTPGQGSVVHTWMVNHAP